MCGLIWRNFRSLKNEHVLRTLFCSLIRPHLEYCTVVFNSISAYQAHRIERVQYRFLNFMHRNLTTRNANSVNFEYLDLCDLYRLPTLKHRRDVNECLFLYKHFHNRFTITDANPFSLHVPALRTRHAHKHILHVPWNRIEVTKRGEAISTTYNGLFCIALNALFMYKECLLTVILIFMLIDPFPVTGGPSAVGCGK